MSFPYGDDDSGQSPPDYRNAVPPITGANPKEPLPPNRLTPDQVDRILGQLTVTWESLPQLPFWAPIHGRDAEWQRKSAAAAMNGLAVLLERPLSSTEANAVAEHACRARVKESYEIPTVLGASAFFTYRGQQTWRFPLWTPQPTSTWFSPHCFPTIKYNFIQGQPAMKLWTATRFLAYVAAIRLISQPLFKGWATAGYGIDCLTDKRLKAVTERREMEMKSQRTGSSRLPATTTAPMSDQQQQQQQTEQNTWSEQPQPNRRQPQQPLPSWRAPKPAQKETSSAFDDNSGMFDDDDASPVAPTFKRSDPVPTASTTATGSSWSKLREQAKSTGAKGAPTASSSTDSYTYNESDRERNYAKDQAQKEFDAMLEQERRSTS
ncbi:hypothetical protein QBC43DRAFT_313563 [Cladorrhinum sp. PSN259]|nr:hypothetical protein QBC43DRAFT_313563 [Cladorrhinum sp. PSN259]